MLLIQLHHEIEKRITVWNLAAYFPYLVLTYAPKGIRTRDLMVHEPGIVPLDYGLQASHFAS